MSEINELPDDAPKPLRTISAYVGLAAMAITALLWLFSVSSKADYAKTKVDEHDKVLENKADKNDVRDGFDKLNKKLDDLTDYLLNNKRR